MQKPNLSFWKVVAGMVFVGGAYATVVRFAQGLGAATNLSDQFPWGIWIGFDVLVGVGLAAGGFVIAATVHIFNLEKYKPISRPAILTAFLGYVLVVVAILFDLGRPYRIWHPLIMWNPHSVMFEVAWCVTLYTIVLALEFSPMVLERFGLKAPLRIIRSIYLPVVILGVLLSTLHQSSLGTLYVIVPDKLYGLWYSPFLPLFFFITAITAGIAMTIVESFLSARAFGKRLEKELLTGLARVIVVLLAVYFVFRVQDLFRHGQAELMFRFNQESVLFWGEIGLGVLLPMCLLYVERIRTRESGLFFSALLVVIGFIVNRLNVSITGMLHSETYFPKWTEIAVTLALVVLGFTIFGLAVKHFHVFPPEETASGKAALQDAGPPIFTRNIVLAAWAVVILGVITFGLSKNGRYKLDSMSNAIAATPLRAEPVEPELVLPEAFDYPVGEDSPGPVTFSHESHVLSQDEAACSVCHFGTFDILKDGVPDTESVTMDEMYEGGSCGKCHNDTDAFAVEECEACHQE